MTTLELRLELSPKLIRDAQAAGLLTPKTVSRLLKDELRRQAARQLLEGAGRASESGRRRLAVKEIQAEVNTVRQTQHGVKSGT